MSHAVRVRERDLPIARALLGTRDMRLPMLSVFLSLVACGARVDPPEGAPDGGTDAAPAPSCTESLASAPMPGGAYGGSPRVTSEGMGCPPSYAARWSASFAADCQSVTLTPKYDNCTGGRHSITDRTVLTRKLYGVGLRPSSRTRS